MKTSQRWLQAALNALKCKGWTVCGTALVSFAAGSLLTVYLTHPNKVKANSNRVFELMIYHTLPGKVPELESIFRDVSKLQAKHNVDVVGYWVPNDDPAWANTFIYLVAQPSLEEAKKNWAAFKADPEWQKVKAESEANGPLVDQEDRYFMDPISYSALK